MYEKIKSLESDCYTTAKENNDCFLLANMSKLRENLDRYEKLLYGLTDANYRLAPNEVPTVIEDPSDRCQKEEVSNGSLHTFSSLCVRFNRLNNEMDYQMANLNHKI